MNTRFFYFIWFSSVMIYFSELGFSQNFDKQIKPDSIAKHEGKCNSGNCINGFGIKEYTKDDYCILSGYVYKGNFLNGYEHGQGTLISYNQAKLYEGTWEKGLFNGFGKFYKADGVIYEGNFKHGLFHGKMKVTNKEGKVIIEGNYEFGKLEGQGFYIDEKGNCYKGNFSKGLLQGHGSLYSKENKPVYEGEWNQGQYKGRGVLVYNNGNKYSGEFANNKPNGKGIYTHQTGQKIYEGNFKDGNYDGEGIIYFENGDKYKGNFKQGKQNGKGTLTYKNGDVLEGIWENDKFLSSEEKDYTLKGDDFSIVLPGKPIENKTKDTHSYSYSIYFNGKITISYQFIYIDTPTMPADKDGQFRTLTNLKLGKDITRIRPIKWYLRDRFPCIQYYWKKNDGICSTISFQNYAKKRTYIITVWYYQNTEREVDNRMDKILKNTYIGNVVLRLY